MNDVVYTETHKGFTINIRPDYNAGNPCEEWDNLGTIAHCKRNGFTGGYYDDRDSLAKHITQIQKNGGVVLPLYLYEHGGQAVNTTGFSCPWDSGQIGYVYATRETILREFGGEKVTKAKREHVKNCLRGQIETLNDYLQGNVYGYQILNSKGDIVDSCWGYYGDYDCFNGVLTEARRVAEYYVKDELKARLNKLKTLIKNHVPLYARTEALAI